MTPLIAFSRTVDAVNAVFGKVADWMVLAACEPPPPPHENSVTSDGVEVRVY